MSDDKPAPSERCEVCNAKLDVILEQGRYTQHPHARRPAPAPAPRCACSVKLNEYARDYYAEKARANKAEAQRDALREALREIADNPLPAEKGYECAWCNGVRKHHKECPCSLAAAALKEAGE